MKKLKNAAILEKNKMAAIRGYFRRGTDPYFLFCYQLAMYQVSCFYHKVNDSSQNCYISAPLYVSMRSNTTPFSLELFPFVKQLAGLIEEHLD